MEGATLAASVASEARPGALEPGLVTQSAGGYFCAGPLQLRPWLAPAIAACCEVTQP